jgi:hypothetical protein
VTPASEARELLVRNQQRLLNNIGWVEPAMQSRVDLKPGQQAKVVDILLQGVRRVH